MILIILIILLVRRRDLLISFSFELVLIHMCYVWHVASVRVCVCQKILGRVFPYDNIFLNAIFAMILLHLVAIQSC